MYIDIHFTDQLAIKIFWTFTSFVNISIKKTRATVIDYSCLDVILKIVELYGQVDHVLNLNLLKFDRHHRVRCTHH